MGEHIPCKISVVVPVYGSESVLAELASQVQQVMKDYGWTYEIIFICDQSPDGSWCLIKQLSEKIPQVRGILLRINAGQHNAIMAGLTVAKGSIVVTMDDDLQHSPQDIPALIHKVSDGYDVAYARFTSRKHPMWKILGSRLNNFMAYYLLHKPPNLYLSPFRAFSIDIGREIIRYRGPYGYIDGLILSVTKKIATVDVQHHERYAGVSYYSFRKSLSLWLKMATGFSITPLRLTSIIGFVFALLGFVLAILFVIQKFTIDIMPNGWSSLIVSILIIGGIQLLALGVIGEYLGRVLLTINARPQYVIADTVKVDRAFEPTCLGN